MPSLNFKAQFAELVASGLKPHTIRAWRRKPFEVGDDLSFFSGMRTKACRRLRPNARCIAASPIEVNSAQRYIIITSDSGSRYFNPVLTTNGRLAPAIVNALAIADGFTCSDQLFQFFAATHGPILCGQLVEWRP